MAIIREAKKSVKDVSLLKEKSIEFVKQMKLKEKLLNKIMNNYSKQYDAMIITKKLEVDSPTSIYVLCNACKHVSR